MAEAPQPSTLKLQLQTQRQGSSWSWRLVLAIVWLTFSVALAIWWLIFGLQQIDRFNQLGGVAPESLARELERQHMMLMSEGATLVVSLLAGGGALLYYINTELRRSKQVREFFAAFTHDLKTSLASLRLQAESLGEDLKNSSQEKLARRLVKDTIRLELQLENALLLASPDDARLFFEPISIAELVQSMSHHWPDLAIKVESDAVVRADQRAIESVFKNIFQNSVVHGKATTASVAISKQNDVAVIRVADNGRGFSGNRARLGTIFERQGPTSGSGLGLSIVCKILAGMGGEIEFAESSQGFCVDLKIPLAVAGENS